MKDKKALKTNLIFAGVLLAVALVLFAVLRLRPAGGVAVLTYEALRQNGFPGLQGVGEMGR